jgi:hypothetical protein
MEDDFDTIEFSVGLYVGDLNIQNAAVDLVNSIFMAMEDAIGFFLSSRGMPRSTGATHSLTISSLSRARRSAQAWRLPEGTNQQVG